MTFCSDTGSIQLTYRFNHDDVRLGEADKVVAKHRDRIGLIAMRAYRTDFCPCLMKLQFLKVYTCVHVNGGGE